MTLRENYENWRREAEVLAGEPSDIPQRAALLHEIFLDSKGNHPFSEVAVHGALWGYKFFETTGTLGNLISYRYVYNAEEMKYRHSLLQTFSDGFKKANRQVFIDTYANYYFTKESGAEKEAEEIFEPPLLSALKQIHRAAKSGERLDAGTRRGLFQTTLKWEQETTVAPAVKAEIAKFDCPILRRLVLRPLVRFSFFPRFKYLWFKNFSDTDERIDKAHRTFEIAEKIGWNGVFRAMEKYQVMAPDFFSDPIGHAAELRERILH